MQTLRDNHGAFLDKALLEGYADTDQFLFVGITCLHRLPSVAEKVNAVAVTAPSPFLDKRSKLCYNRINEIKHRERLFL